MVVDYKKKGSKRAKKNHKKKKIFTKNFMKS